MTEARETSSIGAVFLDRDGVINDPALDEHDQRFESPLRPETVALAEGAIEGLKTLKSAGWLLAVVSNQPAAAKGKATVDQLSAVHERIVELLAENGIEIDEWHYCFHHPDGVVAELSGSCDCRKPQPGMLLDAATRLAVEPSSSWMVGDSDTDIEAGQAAGCRTVLIEHGHSPHRRQGNLEPDAHVGNLADAAAVINQMSAGQSSLAMR